MNALHVLVVDDHPLFLDGLATLLHEPPEVDVVGRAANGADAIARAADLQPDVVVMDLHLPDINGVDATRQIVGTSPHIAVLVLTMVSDDDSVFAAMRAGARGYLLKGADHDDIRRGVRAVARGEAIFGPGVADRVISFFAVRHTNGPSPFPELTPRETEVLALVADGLSNDTIARRLLLTNKTVRNHLSNIFVKLQVTDRAEVIVRARRAGLGE